MLPSPSPSFYKLNVAQRGGTSAQGPSLCVLMEGRWSLLGPLHYLDGWMDPSSGRMMDGWMGG